MYFTKPQLRSYLSHLEFANESISENASQNEFDIFLSHSSKDKEYIIKLKQKFESYHHTVYVDWITDSHLSRNNVDKLTAAQIRKRMKQCKCLLFATSENSSDSK